MSIGEQEQTTTRLENFCSIWQKTQVAGGGQGIFGSTWEHLSSFMFSENLSIVSLLGCSQTTIKNISQPKCLNLHVGNTRPHPT